MMIDPEKEAVVFDIQGFSVHDGPGGRTLVFFKGCPLHCYWCCNPESLSARREVMYRRTNCVRCQGCVARNACPHGAISSKGPGEYVVIDRRVCARCPDPVCAQGCYHDALKVAGRIYTLDELVKRVERDAPYWGEGGGVTAGGGEIAAQWRFVGNFFERLHERYINTAVESSSMAPWEHLEHIYRNVDWAFNDIKHMNPVKHKEATGVDNARILANIRNIADLGRHGRLRQIIRIPVVVGFNDDEENISNTIDFVRDIGTHEINILPFHRLGASKYEQLDKVYDCRDMQPPAQEVMDRIADQIRSAGLACYVGSNTPF